MDGVVCQGLEYHVMDRLTSCKEFLTTTARIQQMPQTDLAMGLSSSSCLFFLFTFLLFFVTLLVKRLGSADVSDVDGYVGNRRKELRVARVVANVIDTLANALAAPRLGIPHATWMQELGEGIAGQWQDSGTVVFRALVTLLG